jgi:hypothetical protein
MSRVWRIAIYTAAMVFFVSALSTCGEIGSADHLYQTCMGQAEVIDGMDKENSDAMWLSYCYGYLLGHYTAVAASPTPLYCITTLTTDQLRGAYVVWYVDGGKDASNNLQSALWFVWENAGFCHRDVKRWQEGQESETETDTDGVDREIELYENGGDGEVH